MLGVTTLSLTQGSWISSISPASGSSDGLSTTVIAAAVDQHDLVLDRRRRGDELEVELALQALLDDLHVEQAEEAAAEAEAQGDRALGLVA